MYYTVGTSVKLPALTINGVLFYGWYTSPNFEGGTLITELNPQKAGEIIRLYARFSTVIYDEDFNESTLDINAMYKRSEGLDYEFNNKTGSIAVAIDDGGNKYIKVSTEKNDASINYTKNTYSTVIAGGGKITYKISLAVPDGATAAETSFKPRGASGGSSNCIVIFKTNRNAEVTLGSSGYAIATLGIGFTRLGFTFDIIEETLTAYSED